MTSHVHSESNWTRLASWWRQSDPEPRTDWNAYAKSYDLLSEYNPAYQELLQEFESVLPTVGKPGVIFDVGGGTGNFSQVAAGRFPESAIYFIEPDERMKSRAAEKLSGHDKITFVERTFENFEAPTQADLMICVHALYTMPEPQARLQEMKRLLKPGGLLFLVDLGRPMDVADWRAYLFGHLTKELGFLKAMQIFWKGREIAKQNKAIFKSQEANVYWTHTAEEISSAVEKAGFEILSQKSVYRGYSDLLLCRAGK